MNSDGTINWDCPCLGNYIYGPCGREIKKAFTGLFSCYQQKSENPNLDFDKMIFERCQQDFLNLSKCQKLFSDYYKEKDILGDGLEMSGNEPAELEK